MASIFGSPLFTSPLTKIQFSSSNSSSSQTPPPQQTPPPSPQPETSLPTVAQPITTKRPTQPKPQTTTTTTTAESTDWIASTLTRRFGLGAGLAWVGFLAFGVVSEQIKTRLEVSQQEANTKDVKEEQVLLPNGIRYYEMRVGGGATPRAGDLVVIDLKGGVEGSDKAFIDTFDGNEKPLALLMGSRPYTKGMCEGIEYVLRSMKAGGKRRVIIPPSLGFGEQGAELGSGLQIPPSATLEYIVQVDKVSIAPA
ncbi:hypothetical protein AAC387_Pa03g3125 [Persea americana]